MHAVPAKELFPQILDVQALCLSWSWSCWSHQEHMADAQQRARKLQFEAEDYPSLCNGKL